MIFSTSIFPNLDELCHKGNISRAKLSEESGIKYDTLGNKLRGDSEFTRSEMIKIKGVISAALKSPIILEEIFTTSSEYDGKTKQGNQIMQ